VVVLIDAGYEVALKCFIGGGPAKEVEQKIYPRDIEVVSKTQGEG
jgi:hypothetical protein